MPARPDSHRDLTRRCHGHAAPAAPEEHLTADKPAHPAGRSRSNPQRGGAATKHTTHGSYWDVPFVKVEAASCRFSGPAESRSGLPPLSAPAARWPSLSNISLIAVCGIHSPRVAESPLVTSAGRWRSAAEHRNPCDEQKSSHGVKILKDSWYRLCGFARMFRTG